MARAAPVGQIKKTIGQKKAMGTPCALNPVPVFAIVASLAVLIAQCVAVIVLVATRPRAAGWRVTCGMATLHALLAVWCAVTTIPGSLMDAVRPERRAHANLAGLSCQLGLAFTALAIELVRRDAMSLGGSSAGALAVAVALFSALPLHAAVATYTMG